LQQAGIWPALLNDCQPITDILVTDHPGAKTDISARAVTFLAPLLRRAPDLSLGFSAAREGSGQPFGWIIQNHTLRRALYNEVRRQKRWIAYHAPLQAASFAADDAGVTVTAADGRVFRGSLLIGADGRASAVRQHLGVGVKTWPYRQSAIVFNITHQKTHRGLALEHFTPSGPFAVLPMTDDEETGKPRSSVVWTVEEKDAARTLSLPADAFQAQLQELSGARLGRVAVATPPVAYPLQLMHAKRYIGARTALIAEAAHVIHPIAGQGLNLSMRDIFALGQVLSGARGLGLDLGGATVLEKYESLRRPDTLAMALFTDGLNRLFSNNHNIVHAARGLGLAGINQIPVLKRFFARQAMGLNQILSPDVPF
jgi:2-octaprenyl-6-methoxyphenol hydroxylase